MYNPKRILSYQRDVYYIEYINVYDFIECYANVSSSNMPQYFL